jgi:AcrR family transcriptional regulator
MVYPQMVAVEPVETPRESKGERTRRALLTSAITRFAADGFRAVSVSDVARDVGISPAAVYAYFPGKEALFSAAVDADAADLIDRALSPVLAGQFDGEWSSLVELLFDETSQHPLARRILAGLEPGFTERLLEIPALTSLRAAIAALLAIGQEVGEVRADIEPAAFADGLTTIVMSLLIATLQTGVPARGVHAAGVVTVIDAALRPPSAPGPEPST